MVDNGYRYDNAPSGPPREQDALVLITEAKTAFRRRINTVGRKWSPFWQRFDRLYPITNKDLGRRVAPAPTRRFPPPGSSDVGYIEPETGNQDPEVRSKKAEAGSQEQGVRSKRSPWLREPENSGERE